MPHFIVECSSKVYHEILSQDIMLKVHQAAADSGLFDESSIKVRVRGYEDYLVAGKAADFIHVKGYILSGRTNDQKKKLSINLVKSIIDFAPDVPNVSVDIRDMDKDCYHTK